MSGREEAIARAVAGALDLPLAPLALRDAGGGGCINRAATCTAGGRTWFVKWNDHPVPGQFTAEATGLLALGASGTPLVVPAPLVWSDEPGRSFLVLEHLPSGARCAGFDDLLGRGLALLHARTSARGFGFEVDGACGATPQPNGWLARWVDFWRERRLGHQLRLARARGLPAADVARGERLLDRLDDWIADDEPPALIHGDLWSGNLHVTTAGQPALIDPAAYFGHREAELAMMTLFGGFSRRVFQAYEEVRPLRPGWRERQDLYALYHVLNHFHLFGGGYGAQAAAILRRYAGDTGRG